jgi:predicted metal-dependent HD superfamily phosphohydrolase
LCTFYMELETVSLQRSNFAAMENVLEYLQIKWKNLTAFSKREGLKNECWDEIVDYYTRPNRYYHNLSHVGNLFHLLDEHSSLADNPALIGFAIIYHDMVYDNLRSDNKEQSAVKAREHLTKLKMKPAFIKNVEFLILATKLHRVDASCGVENDMALFLDIDMAVLSSEWDDYEVYRANIRKEFKQYADPIYKSGRKNALQQIVSKGSIYLTSQFQLLLEEKARQNLNREISLL